MTLTDDDRASAAGRALRAAWRDREVACAHCRKVFVARGRQKYCGAVCRQLAYLARKRRAAGLPVPGKPGRPRKVLPPGPE